MRGSCLCGNEMRRKTYRTKPGNDDGDEDNDDDDDYDYDDDDRLH